ncbi:hypothetical protein POM88_029514 [Heracleum sosnowskyi]|uniref:Uncharacterized protein n=1 Tax=Heracleum sosnowskyi TaxID=360622 RepID=A0AAD8MH84_9APIA|nr:hypothetical protein POM88_029514 [Heracleum sosnowskyi]
MEFLSLQMRIRSHIRAKLSLSKPTLLRNIHFTKRLCKDFFIASSQFSYVFVHPVLRQDMQWLQDFRQYLRGLTRAAQAKQNKGTRLSELRFRRTLTIQFPIFEPEPEPQLERRMSSDIKLAIYCLPAEIQVTIHGLWLGYLDFLGVVHFLLHKKYSQIDSDEAKQVIQQAKQQLSSLDEATKVAMKTMWPNFKGPDDEKFHIHEFARHAFTPKTYKSKYFEEAISAAKPYIGGGKDLHKYLQTFYCCPH